MTPEKRKAQLKEDATKYFDLIPYDASVSLRAPLAPGGVHNPLVGKEKLRAV